MNNINENKNNRGLKIFLILIIVGVCIFGIVKFVQYQLTNQTVDRQGTTQSNTDGNTKLLRRSANTNDITVDSELDLSSFGGKYTILPQSDIDNLEITINFLDSDKKILDSTVKSLGNVKKGVQVSFSISLFDLGLSVAMNAKYESVVVTGGTVSYFA